MQSETCFELSGVQVLLHLGEATATHKSARWNSIALKLSDQSEPSESRTAAALKAAQLSHAERKR